MPSYVSFTLLPVRKNPFYVIFLLPDGFQTTVPRMRAVETPEHFLRKRYARSSYSTQLRENRREAFPCSNIPEASVLALPFTPESQVCDQNRALGCSRAAPQVARGQSHKVAQDGPSRGLISPHVDVEVEAKLHPAPRRPPPPPPQPEAAKLQH